MTGPALGRSYLGPANACLDVATRARRRRVGRDAVKTDLDVSRRRAPRFPTRLIMAALAVCSQRRSVGVIVTPATAAGDIGSDRPLVIMTAKACGLCVGPCQAVLCFSCMVEGEILPQSTPLFLKVAHPAVPRKSLVGRGGAPLLVPAG